MTPGNIKNATRALGAPEKWDVERDGECNVLYVREVMGGPPMMQSAWYPTPEELERIARGEPIILTVWGRGHPPVSVDVYDNERGATN